MLAKIPRTFFVVLLFFALSVAAQPQNIPSGEQMQELRPTPGIRLQLYDLMFSHVARSADEAHQLYTDRAVLSDLEQRLERVRQTGQSEEILSPQERQQFAKNIVQLEALEKVFFEKWYLKVPMGVAMSLQRWMILTNSPEPYGKKRYQMIVRLREEIQKNILYSHWFQRLPEEFITENGPQSWGQLLQRFNEDVKFRKEWVRNHPSSLSQIKELSQVWAWEDSTVRAITVHDSGGPHEHMVLHRIPRPGVPNRFQLILDGDIQDLITLEFAHSLFFNRLSRIANNGKTVTYYLEAVEKGRTMELSEEINKNGVNKRTFRGAELLRKAKVDEFAQRDYIRRGTLRLFLGMRTLQLNQIQELMKIHPELVLAVGQFGFSVTGGRAQTVSNRTDTPQDQLRKLVATMIDVIEFANSQDVNAWFRENTSHVLRTMIGGVGAGGAQALTAGPTAALNPVRSCRDLF